MSDKQFQDIERLLNKAGISGIISRVTSVDTVSGSELYRVKMLYKDKIVSYYVKFHPDRHKKKEERSSFHAYQTASQLALIFANVTSEYGVLSPIYYDVPSACLISEEIEGTSLCDLIKLNGRYKLSVQNEVELKEAIKSYSKLVEIPVATHWKR